MDDVVIHIKTFQLVYGEMTTFAPAELRSAGDFIATLIKLPHDAYFLALFSSCRINSAITFSTSASTASFT